ncbi:hypothetical protein SAMN04488544_3708 [Microlunatus sagamiharensis]|uniref:Uncharacterized protein n=1 Tax=Microlunatus sagamiharensis TaxID=546874 RepID=A0A1H2NBW5_9ACTN|nr:hypothetical protein [Microlunatus sagamiharensis]SDV02864.1 hypothetical protein SAMN04488544_3708 [Microlunatus sagamiharensis]
MTTDPYGDAGSATFGPGGQSPVAPGYGIGDPTPTYGADTGATATGVGGSGTSSTADTAKSEAGAVKDTAAGAAQQVAGTAKDEASNVVGEAKAQAANLIDQVRGEAGAQVGTQKDRLASMAHSYAKELGGMASGNPESGPVTDLVQDLSRRLGGAGHWLENHEPADVLDEVRRFARRRPGAFLLSALAAGVVVGRLTRGAVDEHRAEGAPAPTPELARGVAYPDTVPAQPAQPAYTAAQPGYAAAPAYQGQPTTTGYGTEPGLGYGDQPAAGQPGYGDQGYVEGGGLADPYGSRGATYGTNPGDVR